MIKSKEIPVMNLISTGKNKNMVGHKKRTEFEPVTTLTWSVKNKPEWKVLLLWGRASVPLLF